MADPFVLDEPTSGLDPVMTEEVLQALVAHVASEEMTVVFSSHQIAEVDQIADHVAIIDRGRAVVTGALGAVDLPARRQMNGFTQAWPAACSPWVAPRSGCCSRWAVPGVRHCRRSQTSATVIETGSYFTFLIQASIGPETVWSGVSMENTSDMWLSPFK
jgi:energy-coupling factor transporter ATP-binding protein EcfA2